MSRQPVAGRLALGLLVAVGLLGFVPQALVAQGATAALTGTVNDASRAVVPNATITLKSELSGDTRRTVSNATGFFTISAIDRKSVV